MLHLSKQIHKGTNSGAPNPVLTEFRSTGCGARIWAEQQAQSAPTRGPKTRPESSHSLERLGETCLSETPGNLQAAVSVVLLHRAKLAL